MSITPSLASSLPSRHSDAFQKLCSLPHLLQAFQRAASGKRRKMDVAAFEFRLMDHLLQLREELTSGCYLPGSYTHFLIHEPKRRKISAAVFRDRVVHHALCSIIEPRFEQVFIPDSYANRTGKGTHRAIARLHHCCRSYKYVLRCDIRQHFASIDHAVLLESLRQLIPEPDIMDLIEKIVAGGCDALIDQYDMVWFPGDDLLAVYRPRGLPIGNLTSQFWSNYYLHGFDLFIKRELGCKAYLRYVDDFALFSDSKQQLWQWKTAIKLRLAVLRLTLHDQKAQVLPTANGVPWLGFVVYPEFRKVKARKVRHATRRLQHRYHAYCHGQISFVEFDASIQGWINHVRFADSWGLWRHMLKPFRIKPGDLRQKKVRTASRRYQ
ncbi:MAG: RNA-directed DNA polymerase [Nitrosomonas sp.]|uniref:reverse transcriptase domain-containing protein n=1 Tax=Nitrosomonas sp. TaxID=42353 RepID=UPI0025E194C5|nr:reverse transcriptase domain-containing protein [Nitrosomonas sp.]MBY0474655.1 RNA-directed DNA polymerase [Nitrosomonas sp.]